MDRTVKTICPYCGVGCGLEVTLRGGVIAQVRGDKSHPSTLGMLCPKGAQVGQIVTTPNRLTQAQLRDRDGTAFRRVPLDQALAHVAGRLGVIRAAHGPEAIGFYVSGQLTTESQYVFNKLAKGAIGTNHIDANSRLCMASAVSAYKLALGADGPPTCYDDIELAECFLVLGANMAECHPVLWQRVKKRLSRKRVRVIVVDPRRTPTAEAAHLHIALRPGTDTAFLNGMLHVIIAQGWTSESFIKNHTDGWEAVREAAEAWTPARAAKVCGIEELDIHRAAFWFGQSAEALSFWTMGANQSTNGVAKNLALINLHLATGKIGRPGSGPFSLTGQPNAMGGREVGYMCGLLPGYREVANPKHRKEVAAIWGVPAARIQAQPGYDAVKMFEALESGKMKAIWIAGCNPVATMPEAERVIRALRRAELVVVQDCYHPTETSPYAHVLLPGAMSLEIEGTMTNSERRVSLLQPCVPPPGDARPDWELAARVGALLGFEDQFSYASAADIFEEHKNCCAGNTILDLGGITYKRLKRQAVQWPCADTRSPGAARRYRRKHFATPNGRARFHVAGFQPPVDELTPEYPLALMTGRLANHWHSRTKTGHVAKLDQANPAPFVSIHPLEAEGLNLADGEAVRLVSRRGSARTVVRRDPGQRPGTLFMPFHWGQSYRDDGCVNTLTQPAGDPISKQPELKFAAVRLEKSPEPYPALTMKTDTATMEAGPTPGFTDPQKEYLQGLLTGIAQRGLTPFVGFTVGGPLTATPAPGVPNAAAEETVFGTPLSALTKQERWKLAENPLDSWDRLLAHAEQDKAPDEEDTYRFRTFGLFWVGPAQNAFMLRCRIPAGELTSEQLSGLAGMAEEWGGGTADITTRSNIQIRQIAPRHTVKVLTRLQEIGLTARGSGVDNIRNITASPTAGVDPVELIDTRPLAKALHHYILNHRDLYGLPRKFNVAFDGGGSISVAADTNDIGFLAVRHQGTVGFRVELAGITGHKQFAGDAGLWIKPSECVAVAAAMIRVFSEHGDRTDRKKARLKYLLDRWGVPKFLEETAKKLAFPLVYVPREQCQYPHPPIRHGHVGVYRQLQKTLNYIGVAIPVGHMSVRQMRRLAELAKNYASGQVRLTPWQNLIIPDVPDGFVETVKRNLVRLGFHHSASSIAGGLVACTGNAGCKWAATNTKAHALELARHLESRVSLDQPINIHLTGCPNSCAQHYMGDIGLLGTKTTRGGEQVEGYHIVLGGGFGPQQGVGKEVFKGISVGEAPALLERILKTYLARRHTGESFAEFTRRHEVKALQEMFSD